MGENDLVETWLYEVGTFHYIVVLSIGIFPGERGGVGGGDSLTVSLCENDRNHEEHGIKRYEKKYLFEII